MPKQDRARAVTQADTRAYCEKAAQYLAAAIDSLAANRTIAATSLAIHAAINAADSVTGARLSLRSAGEDHRGALTLLRRAGPDGALVARDLARLLPLETRTEYDPDDVLASTAARAVEQAQRCVEVARRVVSRLS